MQDDGRFRAAYLALVALNWEALERADQLLVGSECAWATPHTEGRLQWLRLELLVLRERAASGSAARILSIEQHRAVQTLAATLLEWLDFDAATAAEIVRLRLGAAQNWLLDEAGRLGQGDAAADPPVGAAADSIAPAQLQHAQRRGG